MKIKIYKNDDSEIVYFSYMESEKVLNFGSLLEFAKELVYDDELKKLKYSDFEIVGDASLTLYIDTVKELIESILNDEDLLALLHEESENIDETDLYFIDQSV